MFTNLELKYFYCFLLPNLDWHVQTEPELLSFYFQCNFVRYWDTNDRNKTQEAEVDESCTFIKSENTNFALDQCVSTQCDTLQLPPAKLIDILSLDWLGDCIPSILLMYQWDYPGNTSAIVLNVWLIIFMVCWYQNSRQGSKKYGFVNFDTCFFSSYV